MAEVVVLLFGVLIGWTIAGIIYGMELRGLRQRLDTITALIKALARPEAEEKAASAHDHSLDVSSASQFAKNTLVHAWWVGGPQQKPVKEEGIY
jgi:hypothetical protein